MRPGAVDVHANSSSTLTIRPLRDCGHFPKRLLRPSVLIPGIYVTCKTATRPPPPARIDAHEELYILAKP